MKTMKLGAFALLLVCGLFPASAFAVGYCADVCTPTSGCGKPCFLDTGSGTGCGGYGCCVGNMTNCGFHVAQSTNSASGEALTLEALFAPEPQPAAPALPAFLAE